MTQPEISSVAPFFNGAGALSFYRDQLGFDITYQEPAVEPFFCFFFRERMSSLFSSRRELSCEIRKVSDWETAWRRPKSLTVWERRTSSSRYRTGSSILWLNLTVIWEGGATLRSESIAPLDRSFT